MKNNKSINIYMGIIGEAYVDKENAYAVLLAAKKNILDVEAIIDAATNITRPLSQAITNADNAIQSALDVYNYLKSTIVNYDSNSVIYAKLFALLGDLNQNDFDDNFTNGGNIYTARENRSFAEQQLVEIDDIKSTAQELLEANRLNAVIRCKEYNIAKEIFESMIPNQSVSPEDMSDAMEADLIRRINAVNNNINYINTVADEIINISDEVTEKINKIIDGTDETTVITNEELYWYAGNINPYDNLETFGFTWLEEQSTYVCREMDEYGEYHDIDFGIAGPLKANKWFKTPLHLVQDGQLIAGIDGGKAKYKYWYVAVPRHILTSAGTIAYKQSGFEGSKEEWAIANQSNTEYVDSLYPCMPNESMIHTDGAHSHDDVHSFIFDERYTNDRIEDNPFGYELMTNTLNYLSINGIIYDIWRVPVTVYNSSRLNVYMKLGSAEVTQEQSNKKYYYIGSSKPSSSSKPTKKLSEKDAITYNKTLDGAISTANFYNEGDYNNPLSSDENSLLYNHIHYTEEQVIEWNAQLAGAKRAGDIIVNKGWYEINELPIYENIDSDSKIFYVAIPSELTIKDTDNNDLLEDETTSPYTLVYYNINIAGNKYNIYITGNEDKKFKDIIDNKSNEEEPVNPEPEIPESIEIDGITYYRSQAIQPGDNYELRTVVSNGVTYYAWVEIEPEEIDLQAIALSHNSIALSIGNTRQVSVTFIPGNTTNQNIIWSSEDENIATVENGFITAINAGNTRIFATSEENNDIYAYLTINVYNQQEGQTLYYWYSGQENPMNMTEYDPIKNDFVSGGGWFEYGTELPTTIGQLVKGGTSGLTWYDAIPTDAHLVAGSSSDPDTSVEKIGTVTINDISYDVWYCGGATGTRHNLEYNL